MLFIAAWWNKRPSLLTQLSPRKLSSLTVALQWWHLCGWQMGMSRRRPIAIYVLVQEKKWINHAPDSSSRTWARHLVRCVMCFQADGYMWLLQEVCPYLFALCLRRQVYWFPFHANLACSTVGYKPFFLEVFHKWVYVCQQLNPKSRWCKQLFISQCHHHW